MVGAEVREQAEGDWLSPVFVLDEDWRFTYVNEDATRIFDESRRKLEGKTFWSQIPEPMQANYRDAFERAFVRREQVTFETRCPITERWYRFQVYPIEDRLSVHATDIQDQVDREQEYKLREQALRDAHAIIADRDAYPRDKFDRLLDLGRTLLATEFATLSRVDPETDSYRFLAVSTAPGTDLPEGEDAPLARLPNCARVVETEGTLVLGNVEREAPELADPTWGISAYLGAPVWLEGEVYGTFCFYSTERRGQSFQGWQTTYVELFADWIGQELEREGGWPADRQA